MLALSRHRFQDAIELVRDALLIDPYSPWLNARLAWAYYLSGDRKESLTQAERALELFPDHESSNVYGTIILAFNGKADRAAGIAESLVRRSPHLDLGIAVYAYALARAGRFDDARSILERLQWLSRERFVLSSFTPAVNLALGDPDAAIADLQSAAEVRCPWFFQMLADPRLDSLRSHPEFVKIARLLERMENAAVNKAEQEA
jgi:tetratricopeptide (TPR) repeat protein